MDHSHVNSTMKQFGKLLRKNPVLWLTLAYVIWQLSLSGAILSAATENQSRSLSDLARITVGLGAGLWVVRLGVAKHCRPVLVGILALVLGWGAMQLEDTIVNACADRTDPGQRRDACAVLLLNKALLEGTAELQTLSDEISSDPTKRRVFAKVLGFAVWRDESLMKEVRYAADKSIDGNALPAIMKEVDTRYERYKKEYEEHADAFKKAERQINTADYAHLLPKLNPQLAKYATCGEDHACKSKIQSNVDRWLQHNGFNFSLPLEAFCRQEPVIEYVNARPVTQSYRTVCYAKEEDVVAVLRKELLSKLTSKDLPEGVTEEQLRRGFSDKPFTHAQWRKEAEPRIRQKLSELRREYLPPAEEFAPGGPQEETGRERCIAIFLPPVALGFSLVVCVLHILTTLVMLGRPSQPGSRKRAWIIMGSGFLALLLPAFFGPDIPLEGFAAPYARWLIFWESYLAYPFGILRPLILGVS